MPSSSTNLGDLSFDFVLWVLGGKRGINQYDIKKKKKNALNLQNKHTNFTNNSLK